LCNIILAPACLITRLHLLVFVFISLRAVVSNSISELCCPGLLLFFFFFVFLALLLMLLLHVNNTLQHLHHGPAQLLFCLSRCCFILYFAWLSLCRCCRQSATKNLISTLVKKPSHFLSDIIVARKFVLLKINHSQLLFFTYY